jgi:hypothetical protein
LERDEAAACGRGFFLELTREGEDLGLVVAAVEEVAHLNDEERAPRPVVGEVDGACRAERLPERAEVAGIG